MSNVTIELPCLLSELERESRRLALAQAEAQLRRYEEDLRRRSREVEELILEGINVCREEMELLADSVRTGEELRLVECRQQVDGSDWVTIRTDTGEEVDRRPLSVDEAKAHRNAEYPF